jgi:pyridoxine 4-dehydrogenase
MGLLAGRPVARLGYGAMQLSGPGGLTAPPRQMAISVLRRAAELGVNHIDTAHFYGAGLANELIRAALSPYPDGLVLVSKLGAEEDGQGKLHPAQRPEQLRAGVEANLRSLGVDRVDVVNLRRLDGPPGIQAEGDQLVDLESQLAEMAALRDERLGVPRQAQSGRAPCRGCSGHVARMHAGPGRAGLAAAPRSAHPADPRHGERRPPRGQHGRL